MAPEILAVIRAAAVVLAIGAAVALMIAVVQVALEPAPSLIGRLNDPRPRGAHLGKLRSYLGSEPLVLQNQARGSPDRLDEWQRAAGVPTSAPRRRLPCRCGSGSCTAASSPASTQTGRRRRSST